MEALDGLGHFVALKFAVGPCIRNRVQVGLDLLELVIEGVPVVLGLASCMGFFFQSCG